MCAARWWSASGLLQVDGCKPGFGDGVRTKLNLGDDATHPDVGGALNERETDGIEHAPAGTMQRLNLKVAPEPNDSGHRGNQDGAGVFDHDGSRCATKLGGATEAVGAFRIDNGCGPPRIASEVAEPREHREPTRYWHDLDNIVVEQLLLERTVVGIPQQSPAPFAVVEPEQQSRTATTHHVRRSPLTRQGNTGWHAGQRRMVLFGADRAVANDHRPAALRVVQRAFLITCSGRWVDAFPPPDIVRSGGTPTGQVR